VKAKYNIWFILLKTITELNAAGIVLFKNGGKEIPEFWSPGVLVCSCCGMMV